MRALGPARPRLHARTALRKSVHDASLMVLGIGPVYGLDSALH